MIAIAIVLGLGGVGFALRLHPTAAGDRWIARKAASILDDNGIDPVPSSVTTAAVICDLGVHADGGGDA